MVVSRDLIFQENDIMTMSKEGVKPRQEKEKVVDSVTILENPQPEDGDLTVQLEPRVTARSGTESEVRVPPSMHEIDVPTPKIPEIPTSLESEGHEEERNEETEKITTT